MDKKTIKTLDPTFIAKNDEFLRHLHILDTLAYESLEAQLTFIGEAIRNPTNVVKHIQLKWIASTKFSWFYDVKQSLLNTNGFIDIKDINNLFDISNKNEAHNIIRRCNVTLFFNSLFAEFDPEASDLSNVDYRTFFDYVVPPELAQSMGIWNLGLKLKTQLYLYKMRKDPQTNMIDEMFPEEIEGPPIYKEAHIKFRNAIKFGSGDMDALSKQFSWCTFTQEMFMFLSRIAYDLDKPILYEHTSSSPSSIRGLNEGILQKKVGSPGGNAKKPRSSVVKQDQDIFMDNFGDSPSKKGEIVQLISRANLNDQARLTNQTAGSVLGIFGTINQVSKTAKLGDSIKGQKNIESCTSALG